MVILHGYIHITAHVIPGQDGCMGGRCRTPSSDQFGGFEDLYSSLMFDYYKEVSRFFSVVLENIVTEGSHEKDLTRTYLQNTYMYTIIMECFLLRAR